MTKEGDNVEIRVAEAHRRAFALITDALGNDDADPRGLVDRLTVDRDDLLDVCTALTWHAAGALLTHSGTREAALALVQTAAIQQEGKAANG